MKSIKIEDMENRGENFQTAPIFPERWSPRAMSGESLSNKEIMSLFEAARWAPSSYNNQPWRFIYAERDSKDWNKFLKLLNKFNKKLAKEAAALAVIISKKTFDHNQKKSRTHSFDAGAARENLALQGSLMNLVIHAMEGFDYNQARQELNVPEEYQIEAMIAIGNPGDKESLPKDLKEREHPSGRKKLEEISYKGSFSSEK